MSNSAFTGSAVILLAIYGAIFVISAVASVKIITKAGYSGWWFLLALVPLVGFIMFLVFAFSKWPIQQRLESAERMGPPPAAGGGRFGWNGFAPPGGPAGPGAQYGAPSPRSWGSF